MPYQGDRDTIARARRRIDRDVISAASERDPPDCARRFNSESVAEKYRDEPEPDPVSQGLDLVALFHTVVRANRPAQIALCGPTARREGEAPTTNLRTIHLRFSVCQVRNCPTRSRKYLPTTAYRQKHAAETAQEYAIPDSGWDPGDCPCAVFAAAGRGARAMADALCLRIRFPHDANPPSISLIAYPLSDYWVTVSGIRFFPVGRTEHSRAQGDSRVGSAMLQRATIAFRQANEPDIVVDGQWSTRPWRPTWYYAIRVAHWSGNSGWAFEAMHHKLYLDNPPQPDVIRFRLTNGVNNLMIERLWRRGPVEFGIGGGPTLVVPVSTVRDQSYNNSDGLFGSRYEFGGLTAYATISHRFKVLPRAYGSFALKTTFSRLDARIASGRARMNNLALHLQWGFSLQNKK